jgi:hypothetical protein
MDASEMLLAIDGHGFEDTDSATKVRFLNATVRQACAKEPWAFLEKEADVTISTRQVTLPSDFRAAMALVIPSLPRVLAPERTDTIYKNNTDYATLTGVPCDYYFIGRKMMVRPVPNATYTGKLFYICLHPTMTSASLEADFLIPPDHHQLIVDGTLYRLYSMEDDPENAALFKAYYDQGVAEMVDTWKRQYDLPDRVVDVWEDGGGW